MELEESGDDKQKKAPIRLKSVLIFVLLPAFIAGFFSFLPKLYDELTKPVSHLYYSVISGPSLPSGGASRRIFAVRLENLGKTNLTNVEAEFRTPTGQIENMVAERTALRPEILAKEGEVRVSIPRMLQGESVTLSVMAVSSTAEPSLSVSLRSTEALGETKELAAASGKYEAILGAFLSSFFVGLALVLLLEARRRFSPRTGGIHNYKPSLINLIVGLSQIMPSTEKLLLQTHDVSYAQVADAFLMMGLASDASSRQRCVLGLRALALIDHMADSSVEIVKNNLKELDPELSDQEFQAQRVKAKELSNSELRLEIIKLLKVRTPKRAVRVE